MQLKVFKNAGWIVGCKIVKAILMLIVTAITARYLGKEKYGIITYASGLCAFVVPIMQLGLN
jgi:O-antigen/teichoic acid export membrane protein